MDFGALFGLYNFTWQVDEQYLSLKISLSIMKTMSVGEFKTKFSEVIEQVKAGEKIAVTFGKKKQIIGYFTPENISEKPKRKLGILEGKATAVFHDDFKMTEEEFINL